MNKQPSPPRTPWHAMPDAILHAPELSVKKHPDYAAAKSGDPISAHALVLSALSETSVAKLHTDFDAQHPILVSAHAFERNGVNAIPEAMADALGNTLGWQVETSIVQTNIVAHTGADGFSRLARQAAFGGDVTPGAHYLMVDDFIGQGGTLANLKGFIETQGGIVIGATALTGKPYSARLTPDPALLAALRHKHGQALENWWLEHFAYPFDCLTQSEARYLERTASADTIRDRITAAEQAGNSQTA